MLRPALGISPFKYKDIIGKKVCSDKQKGDLLKYSDFN